MDLAIVVSIALWFLDREKLFRHLPLLGQDWAVKALARKKPDEAARRVKDFVTKELRLAVARGTNVNPASWDRNIQYLLTKNLIDHTTGQHLRTALTGKRRCATTEEAVEYWRKAKPLLQNLKKIPRETF